MTTILYPNKSYQTVPNNLKVPGSQGPRDPVFQGPRNLKVTFKYELDSKEGPSCWSVFFGKEFLEY